MDSSDITVVISNNQCNATGDEAKWYYPMIVKILFVLFIDFVCLQQLKNNKSGDVRLVLHQ